MSTDDDSPSIAPPVDAAPAANTPPSPRTPPGTASQADSPLVQHTPPSKKASSHKLKYKDPRFDSVAFEEMRPRWFEVPLQHFVDKFTTARGLDRKACDIPSDTLQKLSKLPVAGPETSMYLPLCTTFNEVLALAAPQPSQPRYIFKNVSAHPETRDDDLKIDLAMYPTTARAQEAFEQGMPPGHDPHVARNAWAWMTTGVEVKSEADRAAFYFEKNGDLLRDTVEGKKGQVQIAKYATELMVRQHRTFVFLIYILNGAARITRWDRAGCIVSTPIDLTNEPEQLLNFIHRLALMSDEELGFDTTAVLASQEEVEELKRLRHRNPYAAKRAETILSNQVLYPIYKVRCPDVRGGGTSTYFIGKHSVASYSLTGRATRGFVAFRKGSSRLCFLKDYWRPISDKIRTELAVYERLSSHDVKHVATALGGGDVADQTTITDQYLKIVLLLQRRHCRIVIEQLARPLEDYKDSAEMIFIVYDALQGHAEAWEKAGILHRDISESNIMRVVNQDDDEDSDIEGILIDWDLCKYKDDLSQKATQHGRSGTWPFMSAASLRYPYKPNELADDLESFVHVITYYSLRYHHHDRTSKQLTKEVSPKRLFTINMENGMLSDHVCMFYDMSSPTHRRGVYTGGLEKSRSIREGEPPFSLDQNKSSPALRTLISRLYELLQRHYVMVNDAFLKKHYGPGEWPSIPGSPTPMPKGNPKVMGERRFDRRPLTAKRGTGSIPGPSPLPEPRLPITSGRPLDTHEDILEIFGQICDDIIIREREGHPQLSDKIQDQFYGLRRLVAKSPKAPTGSKRRSTDSGRTTGEDAKRQQLDVPGSNRQGQLEPVPEQPISDDE